MRDTKHLECIVGLYTEMIFTKFEIGQPIRSRLLLLITMLRHAVTLIFDPLTLNVCILLAVMYSNSAPNLSEMGQSALELLRFPYI